MTILSSTAVLKAALVIGTLAATTFQANAVGMRTRMACAGDYFKHCSQYSPGSKEVRSCMRAVGAGLSKSCVSALIADGEVSQAEVNRRRAASQTASK